MIVVIDTNIIVQDFWFKNPNSRIFIKGLSFVPVSLKIPEIVFDETINKYKEFLSEKIENLNKVSDEIERQLNKKLKKQQFNILTETNRYSNFIRKYFQKLKSDILPYPQIDHKEVVKDILERKRPFKKGDSGYRDYLIWQTIRLLDTEGSQQIIIFITNNLKDFGEEGYLSDEFTDKITSSKNIKIYPSLKRFNEEFILPKLKKLDEIKQALNKKYSIKINFGNWLKRDLLILLKRIEWEEILVGFPQGVGDVSLKEILLIKDFQIKEVKEQTHTELIIDFSVNLSVGASVDVNWDDYIKSVEVRNYFGYHKAEFTLCWTYIFEDINIEGILIYNKKENKIESSEITFIEGPHASIGF